jgi:hypothetical protein
MIRDLNIQFSSFFCLSGGWCGLYGEERAAEPYNEEKVETGRFIHPLGERSGRCAHASFHWQGKRRATKKVAEEAPEQTDTEVLMEKKRTALGRFRNARFNRLHVHCLPGLMVTYYNEETLGENGNR